MSFPPGKEGLNSPSTGIPVAEQLAGAYAVLRTAGTPTNNAFDTMLKAGTSYINALMVLRSGQAIVDARKHAGGYYVYSSIVAIIAAVFLIMFVPGNTMTYVMWMMPVAYLAPGLYFTFNSTEYLRSLIYPYKGGLLMHQIPSVYNDLYFKAFMGHVASAVVPVHLWLLFKGFADFLFGGLEVRVVNSRFAKWYPKPVPPVAIYLCSLPLSILMIVLSFNMKTGWVIGIMCVVGAIGSLLAMITANGLDVMRFLETGPNGHILNRNLVRDATASDADPELGAALIESVKLDEAVERGFTQTPIPDRFD